MGLRFRGNYWAFFDKRTELSPWLALHRESINDTELDELMLHGFPRTRTGDTVDCKVLPHFGLVQGDMYADGFFVGRSERQRTAAFTGDLLVIKIPLTANAQKDLEAVWAVVVPRAEHRDVDPADIRVLSPTDRGLQGAEGDRFARRATAEVRTWQGAQA